MELANKVVVITGGSGGIGKAMARAFLAQGAKGIVLADLNAEAVAAAAVEIGCLSFTCDVTDEAAIGALVTYATEQLGPVDLFCSSFHLSLQHFLEIFRFVPSFIW